MKLNRPTAILVVFALEVALLFVFRGDLKSFAASINNLELFKGLGTLLFPAPVAFLLWYWRDSDKQRELHNDAVRLQNENDKLVLEKRILEGEAAVAREKIDKAHLEAQLLDVQSKIEAMQLKQREAEDEITTLERERKQLESLDSESLLELLASLYAGGQPKSGVDVHQVNTFKKLFLTDLGQRMLKSYLQKKHYLASPDVIGVFEEKELPNVELPPLVSK